MFRSKGFNFFSLCRGICENVFHFFTLTCHKPPNSFGILQPLSNTTTVPAEGNHSKRPIVFNNCQVTNNKKRIFLKTTNKRYCLFSHFSSLDWYFLQIPLPNMIYLFKIQYALFKLSFNDNVTCIN